MTRNRETLAEMGVVTTLTEKRAAPRTFRCRVVAGQSRGLEVSLATRPLVVGAEADADLVVVDPKVSRHHVELRAVEGGVRVRDLGSTNGVFADRTRIQDAVLSAGSVLRIGDTSIEVVAGAKPKLPPSGRGRFGGLVGESLGMRELFAVLELAAPTEATVLVEGESGTGKELAARALHDHSPRAEKPFVIVDCGATQASLLESQLFGHKRGAFTGAVDDRRGAFLEGDGGTVFLDEIGELPLEAQARLLRVLETKTVQPVGDDRRLQTDVRIVAATNRDLSAMIEQGTFRFDLFHRLSVVHVLIPPLRTRLEDLEPLVRHFYEGRELEPGPITGANLTAMRQHGWAGNVRELRNVLERALVLSREDQPRFEMLDLMLQTRAEAPYDVVDTNLPFKEAKQQWVESFERRYLATLFYRHGENVSRAAEAAGLTRHHFRELLERYKLRSG